MSLTIGNGLTLQNPKRALVAPRPPRIPLILPLPVPSDELVPYVPVLLWTGF